ncbi:hypothetical protein ACOMHN_037616 [Nucella lapillus]
MVPPFLQSHPDLQSAVGNAPLSSKHPTQLPAPDCLLSIIPLMGGQPSDAPALSPPSPLQQGGQSSNAPALSPSSPLPQGGQPIALALSPSSPPPQDGQPSDAPGLSPSSSTLLLCPSDSALSICHLNSQSAVKTVFPVWDAWILGPENTPYKGGIFQLEITFPLAYPFKAPKMRFITRIVHCNISRQGVLNLDVLGSQWSPALTVQKELGVLLLNNPAEYDRRVTEATRQFAIPQDDPEKNGDA